MENTLIRVLLVEGDAKYARFVRESLSGLTGSRVDLAVVDSLAAAAEQVRQTCLDAVLLNLFLADSQGISTFSMLHSEAPNLAIVILTCCENEALALEALREGAQDYLVKSKVDGKILSRVIRYAIERKRTELKLMAANNELLQTNHDLARSEDALRRALEELRASHQRLKTAQMQLIQAEKMECVGTLAAGVAHEVKNPLQTILMGVAYLSKNLPPGDETASLVLGDVRDAVRRADAIVRDLLSLAAPRQLEMKPENIQRLLDHSLSLVNYDLIRSRIEVIREYAPNLPPVRVDAGKIEQVFINLEMNSIHAMPNGGHLIVRIEAEPFTGLNGAASAAAQFQPGEWVVQVEIEDTGCGIPPEKLPRIFEPFFTTKSSGFGTGLGLPVSKQIIDLHGGAIQLGPAPRGGTRATVLLKTEQESQHEKEENSISGR